MATYKGSQIIPIRMEVSDLQSLDKAVADANTTDDEPKTTRSSFIRNAIKHAIDRQNKPKPKRQTKGT